MSNAINVFNLLQEKFKNTNILNNTYAVGGFVRDIIMNNNPKDLDIVVEQPYGSFKLALKIYNEFKNYVTKPHKLGNYPIWSIQFYNDIVFNDKKFLVAGETIEIAETMSETFPNKFSRQRNTQFADLTTDILRRDFTINSLLMRLDNNKIIDKVNGLNDIKLNIIRCNPNIDPIEIFNADPLRILRGIRFAVRFNWEIEKNTFNAMKTCANRITIISNERILSELKNICKYKNGLYNAILLMDKLNILSYIFPEVNHLKMIKQGPEIRLLHLEGSNYYCKNFIST